MRVPDFDDKDLVIVATTIIALAAMWWNGAGTDTIISSVISGLFGIAVGRATRNG